MTKDTTPVQKETPAQKDKPVHKLRAGALEVAIWRGRASTARSTA